MLSQTMKPPRVVINRRWAGRVLAWSALVATTLVLAYVLQALAASAFIAPGLTAVSRACQTVVTSGDNDRESFMAHRCGGATSATETP